MIRRLIPLILLTVNVISGAPGIAQQTGGVPIATEPSIQQPLQVRASRFKGIFTLKTMEELLIQEGTEIEPGQPIIQRASDPELQTQIGLLELELEALNREPTDFMAEYERIRDEALRVHGQYTEKQAWVAAVESAAISPQAKQRAREELDQLEREYAALHARAKSAHERGQGSEARYHQDLDLAKRRLGYQIQQLHHHQQAVITAAQGGEVESIKILSQQDDQISVEVVIR